MNANEFSHLDAQSNPAMVDVAHKEVSLREAIAESRIVLPKEVVLLFKNQDILVKKGSVFNTAIIAGVMAVKKTSELIPLCHGLLIDNCQINIKLENEEAVITCKVTSFGKTGVEMEALTGVSVAALTIYDMCKSFSHAMVIKNTRLLSKTGGKSDFHG